MAPKLKVLHFEGYCGRRLDLDCPNLTSLTFAECWGMGHVSLQAPLQGLFVRSSEKFNIHAVFPLSNLIDLVSLSIESGVNDEAKLFQALPMMQNLQILDLGVNEGKLLQGLPYSLHEVSLQFAGSTSWDNAVIPMLQQLLNLKNVKILVKLCGRDACAVLSCDLRPFIEMQRLRTFQLGPWEAWTPGSFRAPGQFEVELMRSGSKLELMY